MLLSITKNQIHVKHFPIHYTFKEGEMDKLWKKHFIFATKKQYRYFKLPYTSMQWRKRNEQRQMWRCMSLKERATISRIHAFQKSYNYLGNLPYI